MSWHRKNGPPSPRLLLIWLLLIGVIGSFVACTTKLPPSEDDGRGCYLGVVTQEHLTTIRAWASDAKNGDLLISRQCDDRNTEQLLNDIRRMTHETKMP